MKNKKLFLLDAYALIYRAYFAFINNPRISSNGLNTSAVFGFTNSLLEIIKKENPTHLAVVFDTKEATERHIIYPEYKAQREAMPEGIREALPYIDRLLEAFNVPKIFKNGFEADDVIGTIAKKAEKEGFQVFMMTPDKDFAQLVSENIFIYKPASKWQRASILGKREVLDKFKIEKIEQVIDFLAMTGDAADNIPGIKGVGEKTAQKFINDFGSVEGLYENLDKVKGKIKVKIEESKEIGLLSKKLVTIITDVPLSFKTEDMKIKEMDVDKVTKLFKELEFRTILNKIIKKNEAMKINNLNKEELLKETDFQMSLFSEKKEINILKEDNYTIVKEKNNILKCINEIFEAKQYSIYLPHYKNIKQNDKLYGFAITVNKKNYFILNILDNLKMLKEVFESNEIVKFGYDIKRILKYFSKININICGDLFDTQIAHYLLYPEKRHDLEVLAENYLNINFQNENDVFHKEKLTDQSINIVASYAIQRAKIILDLSSILEKELNKTNLGRLFYDIEMPLVKVLSEMESEGIKLDVKNLNKYRLELENEIDEIEKRIYNLATVKFNISSPKQLGDILFNQLQLSKKPKKTKSGQFSTSEEILLKLKSKHPIIDEILDYRSITKLLSTYVVALPQLVSSETKKIHTTFNQTVVATGRLSSTKPNIQNIPIRTTKGMKVRASFVARNSDYTILSADYSQIELRIMASLSKDLAMINAFKNGIDIHSATASKVWRVDLACVDKTMRSKAKAVNFGIIYGISAFGLSQNIGISRKEAKQIIDQYFEEFSKVKSYIDESIEKARKDQYVETLMGRRRYLPNINSKNAVIRSVSERNAINAPIQGLAADIIKKAMISIQAELQLNRMKSKMLLQVHDELIFDMYSEETEILREIVKRCMENATKLEVPLVVDMGEGENWLQAH
tara:strand:+ start:8929 stop:11664 length:2736 start_codon:yes stop_codon:yes gene_type:complete